MEQIVAPLKKNRDKGAAVANLQKALLIENVGGLTLRSQYWFVASTIIYVRKSSE
jgi:hypothetical protein